MYPFSTVFGVVLLAFVLLDAFQPIILPRRPVGRLRITRLFYLVTWYPWSTLVALLPARKAREQMFSVYGPLALLLFGNRLIYHLGVISYSIYLLHPLFIRFTALASRHFGATEFAYTVCSLVSFVVIWGLSYLSYRFVEIPGRNLITSVFLPKRESGAGVARPTQPASTVQISVEREASLRPATPDQI